MVRVESANLGKVLSDIERKKATTKVAMKRIVSDYKSRAPAWVSQEVTKVYNIKKSEINAKSGKGAGSIQAKGDTVETATLVYSGRLLTPLHFGMTPRVPPQGKNYTIRAQIKKGKKVTIGKYKRKRVKGGPHSEKSGYILFPTSSAGASFIPMQRIGKQITKFSTLSMPQMVSNEKVSDAIHRTISEKMKPRIEKHLEKL